MAKINQEGNITARCPGCQGSMSTFEHRYLGNPCGVIHHVKLNPSSQEFIEFRLFRCAGCGGGGLGTIEMRTPNHNYPSEIVHLLSFFPEVSERLTLPASVPEGLRKEFEEAERCLSARCYRAAAGMFRSVLDKTLRANGYKLKKGTTLEQQIDEAAKDGVITVSRQRRAHEDIRVLGNDVLHDEWHEIMLEDVEPAHRYTQRLLEDFYDDRASTLGQLRSVGRVPDEDRPPATPTP